MKVRATQAIMECLLEQEVDTVFGYPGGTILNLYDELYYYQDKIHHVLTAHEQGAAHAADGYARSTGKVGVCFATSGPGATNLTTGIATAYMDSSPVVFITCNVTEETLGKDAFQEVDITGIAMPITKATYLVRDPQTIPDVMRQAFAVAATGRPGPVLIDFLKNVTFLNTMIDYEFIPWDQNRGTDSIRQLAVSHGLKAPEPDLGDIDTLVEMIAQSERPLLICGGGVVRGRADRQFREFAEKLDCPVAITVMGGGGFPGAHPLTTGMVGMHGTQASNTACDQCDLLIAVGMRFDDRVTGNPKCFGANAKVIHLEIDPAEIDKIVHADVAVIGDVKQTLPLLTQRIRSAAHKAWIEGFRACDKVEYEAVVRKAIRPEGGRIRMGEVVDTVAHAYDNDAVLVTDVGQQQMFAARYFGFRRSRSLVTSGGLGTMGFGLPAAIGAKLGAPDREVCLFAGDGGLQMTIQELGTIFQSQVAVKIVLLNNSYLGMVRQWQELFYDRRYSFTELANPDFGLIARGNGIAYRCVERREELAGAVAGMKACKGAYLLEVRVESEENVFPMVPAGAPVSAIRLE